MLQSLKQFHIQALLVGLMIFLVACAPARPRPLGDGERWLPVASWERDGQQVLCSGGGMTDVRLRGSASDARLVWAMSDRGRRMELAWPNGFSARFVPSLEVLDDHGDVFAREGDPVTDGCLTAEDGVYAVSFGTP